MADSVVEGLIRKAVISKYLAQPGKNEALKFSGGALISILLQRYDQAI